jgi:tight adherence protein B
MSVVLAAGLAGAAAAVLVALPSPGRLRLAALAPASVPPPAARRGQATLLVAVLGAVLAVVSGPVIALLAGGAGVAAVRWSSARLRARAVAAERAGAVQACRVLAAELSAGRGPADALSAAAEPATGPAARALRAAAAAAGLGGDVPAALAAEPASAVAPVLRALAACWTVCSTSGSGLAAAVQRLEEGLRAEQALRRTLDAELAGPRATAALLAVLPGAGLLMAGGLGADPVRVLLATPVGLACLTGGLLLDGLGLLWTQRLVARVQLL